MVWNISEVKELRGWVGVRGGDVGWRWGFWNRFGGGVEGRNKKVECDNKIRLVVIKWGKK